MKTKPSEQDIRAEIAYRERRIERLLSKGYPAERTWGDGMYIAALEWVLGIDKDPSND